MQSHDDASFNEIGDYSLLDRACVSLEEMLSDDNPRAIESVLESMSDGAPQELRERLVEELVAVEAEWRAMRGNSPDWEEYAERFPEAMDAARRGYDYYLRVSVPSKAGETRVHTDDPTDLGRLSDEVGVDQHRILRKLAEGGMGAVYLAEQRTPVKRRVALKVIRPGYATKHFVERFELERRSLALMDHPGIAKVFDAGETRNGLPYFAMEFAPGAPITEYCREKNLTLRETLRLFTDVGAAIQHAHNKAIIHRDIKPSNVLVVEIDNQPNVKVIDFGLAKVLQESELERHDLTGTYDRVGTPLWMSPEQVSDGEVNVDTRTDVHSLGVLLYTLLTGSTPIDREVARSKTHAQLFQIIRERTPPRPSERLQERASTEAKDLGRIASCLRSDLDWIAMKALEKEPHRRYETVASFMEDIDRFLANEPVKARAPDRVYLIRKFVARNRTAAAFMLVASALLLLAATGFFLAWRQSANNLATIRDANTAVYELSSKVGAELPGAYSIVNEPPADEDPASYVRRKIPLLFTRIGLAFDNRKIRSAAFDLAVKEYGRLDAESELNHGDRLNYATSMVNSAIEKDAVQSAQAAQLLERAIGAYRKIIDETEPARAIERQEREQLEGMVSAAKELMSIAYLNLSKVAPDSPKNSEGIAFLKELTESDERACVRLAQVYYNLQTEDDVVAEERLSLAIGFLKQCEKVDDELLYAHYGALGRVKARLGDREGEDACLRELAKIEERLLSQGHSPKKLQEIALLSFQQAFDLQNQNNSDDAMEMVVQRYDRAIDLMRKISIMDGSIQQNEMYYKAFWYRAEALIQMGRPLQAFVDYTDAIRALESRPPSPHDTNLLVIKVLRCRAHAGIAPVDAAGDLHALGDIWDSDAWKDDARLRSQVVFVAASINAQAAGDDEATEEQKATFTDRALGQLTTLVEAGEFNEQLTNALQEEAEFDSIREDDRFKEILNQVLMSE